MKIPIKNYIPLFIILFFWIISIFFANPTGEFPLNDDWCYSKSLLNLVENGKFINYSSNSVTFITQFLWGYLFCIPFGFSFVALRISTVVMALTGLIFFYKICLKFISVP
ncbi:MAG: hypothetical protein WC223_02755 [Bacteroidales bacterium]